MSKAPAILALASAVIAAGLVFVPGRSAVAARVPMDLDAGAATTTEFKAVWNAQHHIGIEMEGSIAEKLFPCTVDVFRAGRDCEGGRFPTSLDIALTSQGIDLSDQIHRSTSSAGGSYSNDGGTEIYVWPAATVQLSRGRHYTLSARSLTDGSIAAEATPMLRIEVNSVALLEAGASRLLMISAAFVSFLGSLTWLLVSMARGAQNK